MASAAFQSILAPCYRLQTTPPLEQRDVERVRAFAGPRIYRSGRWAGTIEVPVNVAWAVEQCLLAAGYDVNFIASPVVTELAFDDIAEVLRKRGEVRDDALAMLFDYQQEGISFAASRRGALLHYAGGAGKTLTLILSLFARVPPPQPIVIVTKAAARGQWAQQIERFTSLVPHVIAPQSADTLALPQSARWLMEVPRLGVVRARLLVDAGIATPTELREALNDGRVAALHGFAKKSVASLENALAVWKPSATPTLTLDEYLTRQRETKRRPVVVVAWSSLVEVGEKLGALLNGVGGLGLDEVQGAKNAKRAKVKVEIDGTYTHIDMNNMVSAAAKLTRAANVRYASTATPIKDRLRDLWAVLDYVEPSAWGTFSTWARRYTGATPGAFGGLITTGIANEHIDELTSRMSFVVHRVPYERSHASLLGLKRRESWSIDPSEFGEGWSHDRLLRELKAATHRGASAVLEVQIAAAASVARPAIVARCVAEVESYGSSGVDGGGRSEDSEDNSTRPLGVKICILDARHDHVDALAADLRKAMPGVEVLNVHGGNTTPERREAVRRYYMDHPGPCVLVATGESVGTAYDLHDTDLAILAMLPWTPGDLHQWEQRFCVMEGQFVQTRHGVKLIENIMVGDEVLTYKGRWRPVTHVYSKFARNSKGNGNEVIVEIKHDYWPDPLVVTFDHEVAVRRRGRANIEWVRADEIRVGDDLVAPRMEPTNLDRPLILAFPPTARTRKTGKLRQMPPKIKVTPEVAWLFGLYLGDGWTSTGTMVGIAAHEDARSQLERARAVFNTWGLNGAIRQGSGKCIQLIVYSTECASWFAQFFGADGHSKHVPDVFFTASTALVGAFLRGYWDADGHRQEIKQGWTTVSDHIAHQIPVLLARLGQAASTWHRDVEYPWWLVAEDKQAEAKAKPRCHAWGSALSLRTSRVTYTDHHLFLPVRETRSYRAKRHPTREKLEGLRLVYDLTVAEDESFVVGQSVVHNCRHSQKRAVRIIYAIPRGTAAEHIAGRVISKLPAVEKVSLDTETATAYAALSGTDDKERIAAEIIAVLGSIDADSLADD